MADVSNVACAGVSVVTFSEDPETQTRACELIAGGVRRARSSLVLELAGASPPRIGDALIVVDGANVLRCICRITNVGIKAFADVDASDAYLEGIGDRSLDVWRVARAAQFARRAQALGYQFDAAAMVLLERFDVIWRAESTP